MENKVLLVNNVEMTLDKIESSIMKCEDIEILKKMVMELLKASMKSYNDGDDIEAPIMEDYLYRRSIENFLRRERFRINMRKG
jgi:hypothetical protein